MDTKGVSDQWHIPDALWERLEPLLPEYARSPKGGQPRLNLRRVLDGIFSVLRTGCQWKAAPREFGSASALHNYFQEWTRSGVFLRLWQEALYEYDELKGIQWGWQSIDGAMTKAPLGGKKTGRNPTDRGKSGAKRSVLTDGAGVPIGVAVAGANEHDKWLVGETLRSQPVVGPEPTPEAPPFLDHPEVPSDNNPGARPIRPAVIVRKNSYANGSAEGAETQAVLMSVFRTLKQRGHNPVSAVVDAVRVHLQTGKLPPLPEPIAENG